MTKIIELEQIKEILKGLDPINLIEEGFVAYSKGNVVVPPVGEMIFTDPPGDCHIKYGYIKGGDYYVIKIAQGFYDNPKLGLPAMSGLNLVFNQKNGLVECILLDDGHLTNIRTAAAGAVAAKYLAPAKVKRIGIYGTGIQGKLQLDYLKSIVSCRDVLVWGRSSASLEQYLKEMKDSEFTIHTTLDQDEIPKTCNLIITCTPSQTPLVKADLVQKGTHITAVGSDTHEKQELESIIFQRADRIISDSLSQAESRGECFKAMQDNLLTKKDIIELGHMIEHKNLQRNSDDEITIADLTGVAVQDIQISKAVLANLT